AREQPCRRRPPIGRPGRQPQVIGAVREEGRVPQLQIQLPPIELREVEEKLDREPALAHEELVEVRRHSLGAERSNRLSHTSFYHWKSRPLRRDWRLQERISRTWSARSPSSTKNAHGGERSASYTAWRRSRVPIAQIDSRSVKDNRPRNVS